MIKLKDGTTITDYHEQDCCENVYADWSALEDTTFNANDLTCETLDIQLSEYGFSINGYFVPCYNQQNGYYSSELELRIRYLDGDMYKLKTIDISNSVKDEIDL